MRTWLKFSLLALFFLFSLGHSTWNRNDSHLKWKVWESDNFRFYYDKSLEEVAGYVAAVAEQIYEEKTSRYNIELPGKVELIIRDDIFSNGWANSYQNTMTVWVTDWGIPLRSTHNWLRDVITHEFAHLVSIQTGSKLPTSIFGVVIAYQDYFNEEFQTSLTTVFPFTSQPNWLAEGVAQYESEITGHDSWDSHRDMIVRTAVMEDSLLSLDRMAVFAGKGLHYEQGPYTQGYAFVRYLAKKYGDEAIKKLWLENSKIYRQTLSGVMKKMWGKSGDDIWEEWKNFEKLKYTEQIKSLGAQVVGEKLTKGSFFNQHPNWSPDGNTIYYISNKGRKGFSGILYKYQWVDSIAEDKRIKPVSGAVRGYFDIGPKDSVFTFAAARDKNKHGESRWDIYEKDLRDKSSIFDVVTRKKRYKRFTKLRNAIHPSYNHDGTKIVYVRGSKSNFTLCVTDTSGIRKKKKKLNEIFPLDGKKRFGFNIYTPKYHPQKNGILFSFYDGESRKIGWIEDDGRNYKTILDRPYDDRDPEWHPDGNSFFFSSDSTGIYNIYQYDLNTNQIHQVTNVTGGAFTPALHPSGKHLAYINYDVDGFSLYLLENWKPSSDSTGHVKYLHLDTAYIEPLELAGGSENYIGIPNRAIFQPIIVGQEMTSSDKQASDGSKNWLVGLSMFANDAVRKNEIGMGALFEVGKGFDYFGDQILEPDKESEIFASYWNHSTPVSVGLGFVQRNLVTFDTIVTKDVNLQGDSLVEKSNHAVHLNNAQLSFRYQLFSGSSDYTDPTKQSFLMLNMGYSWNRFNFYDLPFGFFKFTFYKDLYISPLLWYYGGSQSSKSNVAPKGLAAVFVYTYHQSELLRQGSFRETFTFDENGLISGNFRKFTIQDFDMALDYGLSIPWSKSSSLRISTRVGSIMDWKNESDGDDPALDTLDSYFQRGLFLRGYPYLENTENLLLEGEHTVQIGFDLNQVILSDLYKSFWIVFIEDLYAHLFWEAGRAWDGQLNEVRIEKFFKNNHELNKEKWHQSVGWGLKLNSRIYHNYPFNIFLEFSRALVDPMDFNGNEFQIDEVKLFGLNTGATRVNFGVSFGFYNGLLSKFKTNSGKLPKVRPIYSR